jgi:fatty acid desaturase
LCQVATYVTGLRYVGWRFLPRMLLSTAIMSYVTITLFMVSHIGPRELDGQRHAAESRGDWGEYQLRTAVGWGYEWGACASVPFLLVNHQPLHHLFPALHHSRLPSLVPLVREAYPGLLADEPGLGAFVQAFRAMYHTLFSSTAGERARAPVNLPMDVTPPSRGGGHEKNERADEREEEDERDERVCSVCDECDSSAPCCQCQFAIRNCCAGK